MKTFSKEIIAGRVYCSQYVLHSHFRCGGCKFRSRPIITNKKEKYHQLSLFK